MSVDNVILVLHIEDDVKYRDRLLEAMAKLGDRVQVDVAGTLGEALILLAKRQYNVILLDMLLPDATTMESIRAIRAIDSVVPIIILTAARLDPSSTMAQVYRECGTSMHVWKEELILRADILLEYIAIAVQDRTHVMGIAGKGVVDLDAEIGIVVELRAQASVERLKDSLGKIKGLLALEHLLAASRDT